MTAMSSEITSSGKHKTLGVQGEGVSMSSMVTIWLIVFVVLVINAGSSGPCTVMGSDCAVPCSISSVTVLYTSSRCEIF